MALFASVINVDRCLAHPTWRVKREKKITADRMAAYSDAVFAVIVTIMVLELKAPNEAAFSSLWPLMAHGHQLCGELPAPSPLPP